MRFKEPLLCLAFDQLEMEADLNLFTISSEEQCEHGTGNQEIRSMYIENQRMAFMIIFLKIES